MMRPRMTRSVIALSLLASPSLAGDKGGVVNAANGAVVTIAGILGWDGDGWGWCVDRRLPDISSTQKEARWRTRIDCRGSGGGYGPIAGGPTSGCEDEPVVNLQVDRDKWQVYVSCPLKTEHTPQS